MKRNQVTCYCKAYPFPHRLQGGNCDGSEWFNHVFRMPAEECLNCPCNRNSHCDCADGAESKETCMVYSNLLENGIITEYPVDAEEKYKQMFNEYYQGV